MKGQNGVLPMKKKTTLWGIMDLRTGRLYRSPGNDDDYLLFSNKKSHNIFPREEKLVRVNISWEYTKKDKLHPDNHLKKIKSFKVKKT